MVTTTMDRQLIFRSGWVSEVDFKAKEALLAPPESSRGQGTATLATDTAVGSHDTAAPIVPESAIASPAASFVPPAITVVPPAPRPDTAMGQLISLLSNGPLTVLSRPRTPFRSREGPFRPDSVLNKRPSKLGHHRLPSRYARSCSMIQSPRKRS